MATYLVRGGKPLSGVIQVESGKNSPIALLCAALLMRGITRFSGIVKGEEVLRLLDLLSSIGVVVSFDGDIVSLDTRGELHVENIDKTLCAKLRISLLLLGALSNRISSYTIFRSGGCHLGERTTRPHTIGLEKLGMRIARTEESYVVEAGECLGAHVTMYESSDTATENIIMAAVLARGNTTITFASANYMVQDLCYFLVACGAKISGIGSTTLSIEGVSKLVPPEVYAPMPDPVDALAWISLAVATDSQLTVRGCPADFVELEMEYMRMMGQNFSVSDPYRSLSGHFTLIDVVVEPSRLSAIPDKLHPRPFPGMNTDAIPLFWPILVKAQGSSLVHDWMYEVRSVYALELKKLGADVELLDQHRVVFRGGKALHGETISCVPALRPGMALLICMLAASGESKLTNVSMIERGYGNVVERLQALGADIIRID